MARFWYPQNTLFKNMRPEEDAELVKVFLEHPILFMEKFLWVANKEKGLMPFKLKPDQRLVYEMFQDARRRGVPLRFIVCKSRQVGISTFIESWVYTMCRLRPNTNALILAHQATTSEAIFDIFKTFNDNLPEEMRPDKKRRTTSKFTFENSSSITTATAKNSDPSRGFALNMVHASEVSIFADAEKVLDGISKGTSKGPESLIVLESTPSGVENSFYEWWTATVKQKQFGDELWEPIFLPFWANPDYELPISAGDHEHGTYTWESLSDTERRIVTTCQPLLTGSSFADWQRKIKWRRREISESHNNERITDQEYPWNAKECFLASGESIYDMAAIQFYMRNTMRHDGRRCNIRRTERGRPYIVDAHEYPERNWRKEDIEAWQEEWPLVIYEEPRPNERHALGADAAMGSRQESRKSGGADFSTIEVFSWSRVQRAEYRKRIIDPHDFAEVLASLGEFYGGSDGHAVINLEGNSGGGNAAGYGALWRLKQIYPIGRLWRWPKWDDASAEKQAGTVGFEPTVKGLQVLLAETMRELRRGAGLLKEEDGEVGTYDRDWPRLKIHSEALLSELSSYKLASDGSAGAAKGKHDDLVRAFGMAVLALKTLGPPPSVKHKEEQREFVKDLPYNRFGRPTNTHNAGHPNWLLT